MAALRPWRHYLVPRYLVSPKLKNKLCFPIIQRKIENSVKIINSIEDGKFGLLLNRIANFLSNETGSKPFTPAEEGKLQSSLELSKTEVETLVEGIIELFKVSAYYMIKPNLVTDQLAQGLNVTPSKAETFSQVWANSAKGIVDNLKQKIYFPQLSHISYSISVETGSTTASKEKTPKAQLQLGVLSTKTQENINLEFNHEELYEFYKKLEQVQTQLDTLR